MLKALSEEIRRFRSGAHNKSGLRARKMTNAQHVGRRSRERQCFPLLQIGLWMMQTLYAKPLQVVNIRFRPVVGVRTRVIQLPFCPTGRQVTAQVGTHRLNWSPILSAPRRRARAGICTDLYAPLARFLPPVLIPHRLHVRCFHLWTTRVCFPLVWVHRTTWVPRPVVTPPAQYSAPLAAKGGV